MWRRIHFSNYLLSKRHIYILICFCKWDIICTWWHSPFLVHSSWSSVSVFFLKILHSLAWIRSGAELASQRWASCRLWSDTFKPYWIKEEFPEILFFLRNLNKLFLSQSVCFPPNTSKWCQRPPTSPTPMNWNARTTWCPVTHGGLTLRTTDG